MVHPVKDAWEGMFPIVEVIAVIAGGGEGVAEKTRCGIYMKIMREDESMPDNPKTVFTGPSMHRSQ